MASFYQQQQLPFLLETSIEVPHIAEMSDGSCCIPSYCYPSQVVQEVSVSADSSQMGHSSVVTKAQTSIDKKRKNRDDLDTAKGSKSRKNKKSLQESTEDSEEPPKGYIHVRARRGQATDSHSLAERVRREKISLRMKVLQGLVPGCDKVAGKALMLDEIINYVQSLQNQVEFLSMKLASLNPVLYEFDADINDFMDQQEALAMEERTNNCPMMNSSEAFLMDRKGTTTAFSQENGGYVMQVGEQGQGFLSKVEFNNMVSFQ